MITQLSQLSVARFIQLASGDIGVIREGNEKVSEKDLEMAMRNILIEYRDIADPSGSRQYLSLAEDRLKARLEVMLFTLCRNLIEFKGFAQVREVLSVYSINAQNMAEQRITAEVDSRLERAKRKLEETDSEDKSKDLTPAEIRRQFDEQTAALMAYFKFQIDDSTMKANIYAHLIARFNMEIKAQISAKQAIK